MKRRAFLFLLCLAIVTGCGTHRKIESGKGKDKKEKIVKEETAVKDIDYNGAPWVSNVSSPLSITRGLQNRHLSVWASHGRYYNQNVQRWVWQRPYLFCTTEDMYTQTIVVPYLIPMLERAGATVFTPRERDWQKNEVIVDNDNQVLLPYYTEIAVDRTWRDTGTYGFACNNEYITDGYNPFRQGTSKMADASKNGGCEISYQPKLPESGEYAVYVSYATLPKSVPDARYTVYHKGKKTTFKVNQCMGGGTWVYIGTFDFDEGFNSGNRVVLTNESSYTGVVTADAVRFGGGKGNISRGGSISGLPRFLEGSRYYAQWAGAPDSVCYSKDRTDDYKEDINARSYMTNWLAGGSCFAPDINGLGVPLELSLAIHSDAGYSKDYSSLFGSLAICTTNTNNGKLGSGQSRQRSKQFAKQLLDNINRDIKEKYGKWNKRDLYDRNYSETRCPQMVSAILETLSHQNFPDMVMGQDPNFRFTLARSIYKTILKYIAKSHDKPYTVTPLTPTNFRIDFAERDTVVLNWNPQTDKTEPSARSKAYILYTSTGEKGFDNGIKINGTACKIKLSPDLLYNFRVTAINEGGESFPTEVMSAVYHLGATRTVLVINGFNRLSSPAIINDSFSQGFDLNEDGGVSNGKNPGFSGAQICFDKTKLGIEGRNGLGYSGSELEGLILRGNEFNYVPVHAKAIMSAGKYNIVSCSKYAVERDKVDLERYDCIDLILGLEKDDGHSLLYYKTFSEDLQDKIARYTRGSGNIIVSGAYVSSDMTGNKEKMFLNEQLHLSHNGMKHLQGNNTIKGMNTTFDIYTRPNEEHYAATSIDLIKPISPAFCALTEQEGNSVCVAYDGHDYRSFTMSFPFECIKSEQKRSMIMRGILNFIFK